MLLFWVMRGPAVRNHFTYFSQRSFAVTAESQHLLNKNISC